VCFCPGTFEVTSGKAGVECRVSVQNEEGWLRGSGHLVSALSNLGKKARCVLWEGGTERWDGMSSLEKGYQLQGKRRLESSTGGVH